MLVPLSQGEYAVIDAADADVVGRHNWTLDKGRRAYYACRFDGDRRHITLHGLLCPTDDGQMPDHIDGDGLNNRRSNLRVATNQLNQANRSANQSNRSGFKGVTWDANRRKWRSQIRFNGRNEKLGSFLSAEDAARAYDAKAIELFGAFARLNFPAELRIAGLMKEQARQEGANGG